MIYWSVHCEQKCSLGNFRETRAALRATRTLRPHQTGKIAPTSPLFSEPSAHLKKSAYLIESNRHKHSTKSIRICQFRTPLHSFPGSLFDSIFYELHTGGVGCRVLIVRSNGPLRVLRPAREASRYGLWRIQSNMI